MQALHLEVFHPQIPVPPHIIRIVREADALSQAARILEAAESELPIWRIFRRARVRRIRVYINTQLNIVVDEAVRNLKGAK